MLTYADVCVLILAVAAGGQVGIDLRLLGVGLDESQSIGLRKAHRLAGSSSS